MLPSTSVLLLAFLSICGSAVCTNTDSQPLLQRRADETQPLALVNALQNVSITVDQTDRGLQDRIFDIFVPEHDECMNGSDESSIGPCVEARFPTCRQGTLICYNRRPRRDKFYADNRQPYFYIDYRNVYCYPDNWGGCSSCTPGRYCRSENRCILDEKDYPCEKWI